MMTHHIATSSLIFSMIFANQTSIGCIIAFLHDVSDISAAVTKYLGQTKYSNLAAITFIINMVIWAYTRNICLTYMVAKIWTEQLGLYNAPFEGYWPIVAISAFMLTMLVFLSYYWYFLFF